MNNPAIDQSALYGENAAFIEALYEDYLHDPYSVVPIWRDYFDTMHANQANIETNSQRINGASVAVDKVIGEPETPTSVAPVESDDRKQVAVLQLINTYRYRGLSQAKLDPLGLVQRTGTRSCLFWFHRNRLGQSI